MSQDFITKADLNVVNKTIEALKNNGIDAILVSREDAKQTVLDMITKGSEVMTMTSVTLDELGISDEINNSGNFDGLKPKLYSLDKATQGKEMKIIGAVHDYVLGSVHAVTEDGQLVIASLTGSQIPAYVYTAENVIWVIGTQKITKDLSDAMERINTYTLELESERARKAYGVPGSAIAKTLIFSKEIIPGRVKVVFVDDVIGY
jgi:hypothetical protein